MLTMDHTDPERNCDSEGVTVTVRVTVASNNGRRIFDSLKENIFQKVFPKIESPGRRGILE